ncbi:hypothetical protein SCUCBS95973_003396 [Sporothrix curviconia]|uniref:Uncharacterized protein n=1 Tax=Sporothrix curviconia TaxID=1260050 RepID=A0ABP0BF27_9PEZI
MTQAQLDKASGSTSSGGEEDWHSTPASPAAMSPVNGCTDDSATAKKATENAGEKSSSPQKKAVAKTMPATASSTAEVERGAAAGSRPGSDEQSGESEQGLSKEQGGPSRLGQGPPTSIPPSSGPASESGGGGGSGGHDDAFSDIALDEQWQSVAASSVAASEASEAARVFATPPMPSTPTMPPLPERPRAARISTASILANGGDSPFADEETTTGGAGPSSSSSSAAARHSMPPPLPPRNSIGASPVLPLPPKRRAQRGRPISLASVMGSGVYDSGTASPSSSTASPRSSSFFSPSYLNRALPQTPTSVVSGSSRPPSYGGFFFSSPSHVGGGGADGGGSNNTRTRPLSLPMDVPRPLRLQPSPRVRSGTGASTPGGSNGGARASPTASGGEQPEYDMAWLRAHQSAARMARRRQREQHMAPDEHKRYLQLLESHEGAFEVLACFLQRLARAENETLEPENFPTSSAEQQRQKEAMESMRQETVEALTPLLAYGPSDPTPPPPPLSSSSSSSAAAPKHKAISAPGHSIGLPPTPPLSPHRRDVRRESGMSSITETSLGGGGGGDNDDSSSIFGGAGNRASTDTWRSSMKRASALFSGWGGASTTNTAPASTTRFSGD